MKSKLSLTVVYIVLIIYFKVRLPEYTVAELENDLKITLYACYNDALVPLWKHFMYDNDHGNKMDSSEPSSRNTAAADDTSRKKAHEKKLLENKKRGGSGLEHFDSWKIQDDLRIHPIDDVGPPKPGISYSNHHMPKSKQRKSKEGVRKLEDDIVVTTVQILASNVASPTVHPQNKPPSSVDPPKENKSSTQFGAYVPSIQQWEDKSRTTATRPPTCNC